MDTTATLIRLTFHGTQSVGPDLTGRCSSLWVLLSSGMQWIWEVSTNIALKKINLN